MVSRMALGLPGRLRIRDLPLMPAVCLDRTAVGTCLHQATGDVLPEVQMHEARGNSDHLEAA